MSERTQVPFASAEPLRVIMSGTGKMGAVIMDALEVSADFELVGAINRGTTKQSVTVRGREIEVAHNPGGIEQWDADVVVDLSHADWTQRLLPRALARGIRPVIGTSGIDVDAVRSEFEQYPGLGGVVASNFTRSGVLLTYLARLAAPHFAYADIFEEHRPEKVDSPSGTASATAQAMWEARGSDFNYPEAKASVGHQVSRGENVNGVAIHSARRPAGRLCRHEVVFTDATDTLTITQDTIDRAAMIPLIFESIRMAMRKTQLVVGLDELLGLPPLPLVSRGQGDEVTCARPSTSLAPGTGRSSQPAVRSTERTQGLALAD